MAVNRSEPRLNGQLAPVQSTEWRLTLTLSIKGHVRSEPALQFKRPRPKQYQHFFLINRDVYMAVSGMI